MLAVNLSDVGYALHDLSRLRLVLVELIEFGDLVLLRISSVVPSALFRLLT
jgi:hypothetical protein